jgi:hypothetical protein
MFFIATCAGFMPGNGTFDAYFYVSKVSLWKERQRVRQLRRAQAKFANKQKPTVTEKSPEKPQSDAQSSAEN